MNKKTTVQRNVTFKILKIYMTQQLLRSVIINQ